MNPWLSQTIVQALGWTLVHFLWQGLVIAALLATGLRLVRNRPAHYKYLAACVAMALMALAPLATFRLVLSQTESLPAITPISAKISAVRTSEIFIPAQPTRATIPGPHAVEFLERLNHLFPWLVLGWLAGVCALSGRLFLGWLQVRRLRRTATHPLPSPWPEKLSTLAQRLGVNRSIQLLQSTLIEVPTVIGWLRPVILLPASCVTGLTPGQLEAIIAHELAHIRRHDYLVNLLQSIIETLLFYHPAVWWVSRRIRDERENCCDDLAVEMSGDLVGYARALATLEELRPASAQLMLAAGGAPLLQRIRRLAGQPERSAGRASWPVAGIALLLVLGILAAGRMEHHAAAAPQLADGTNVVIAAQAPPSPVTLETNTNGVWTFRVLATKFVYTGLTNQPQIATLIQDGKILYESGNYDEAVIKFQQALAIDPTSLPASQYLRLTREKLLSHGKPIKLVANSVVTPTTGTVTAASPNRARPAGDLPEINIKAKFVEITTAPGDTNMFFTTNGPGAAMGSFTGFLTDPQFRATIKALEQRQGTDVLSAPEVTTESGRQAQMQIGDMQKIVLPGKGTNVSTTNMFFGETLDTLATVSADKKSINMRLIPSISEFKGYVKVGTNPAAPALPSYELRQTTANVAMWDAQTVVIGGFATVGGTNIASQSAKKEILIFVTGTLINPDGTRYHSEEEEKALLAGPPPQPGSTNQ